MPLAIGIGVGLALGGGMELPPAGFAFLRSSDGSIVRAYDGSPMLVKVN